MSKMKKALSFVLLLCMLLSLFPASAFAAAEPSGEPAATAGEPENPKPSYTPSTCPGHQFGNQEPTPVYPATCVDNGVGTKICELCGKTCYVTILATGKHTKPAEGVDHQDPTCAVDGYDKYTCEVCKKPVEDVLEATGEHDYQDNGEDIPATCTEPEMTGGKKCSVCGAVDPDNKPGPKPEGQPAKGHSLGATADEKKVAAVEATCVADGHPDYWECKECHQFFTEWAEHSTAEGLDKAPVTKGSDLENGGHEVKETITPPTCTEPGKRTTECKRGCETYEAVENEPLWKDGDPDNEYKPLGHDFANEKCVVTAATEGEANAKHTVKCLRCEETTEVACTFTEKTESATCGHGNLTIYTCACGYSYTVDDGAKNEDAHEWQDVVETYPATCTSNGVGTIECKNCHAKRYVTVAAHHTYEQDGDKGNKVYGAETPAALAAGAKAATCTTTGTGFYKCTNPDCPLNAQEGGNGGYDTANPVEVPKTAHQWANDTEEATCTADGGAGYRCSVCKVVPTQAMKDEGDTTITEEILTNAFKTSENAKGHQNLPELGLPTKAAKDATCVEGGNLAVYLCPDCGKYFSSENYEAAKNGTVDEATGKKTYPAGVDSADDTSFNTAIDPDAHNWGEGGDANGWNQTKAPTCTEKGEKQRQCQNVGCALNTTPEKADVAALGHDWGSEDGDQQGDEVGWADDPARLGSDTEPGWEIRTCHRNGCDANADTEGAQPAKEERQKDKSTVSGHSFEKWNAKTEQFEFDESKAGEPTETVDATCATAGSKTYTCINPNCKPRDGEETNDEGTKAVYVVELEKLQHEYERRDLPATCTENAREGMFCKNCGEQQPGTEYTDMYLVAVELGLPNADEYKATGHNFVGKEAHVEDAKKWNGWVSDENGNHSIECLNEGCEYYDNGKPDQTTKPNLTGKCEDGKTTWVEFTVTEADEAHEKVTADATCSAKGYKWERCTLCGYEKGTELEEVGTKHVGPYTYTSTSETELPEDPITADEAADISATHKKTCTACGEVVADGESEEIKCNFVAEAEKIPATCAEGTLTVYKCECGNTYKVTDGIVNSNGHTYEPVPAYPATCTSNGVGRNECTGCGKINGYTTIPPLGHLHERTNKDGTGIDLAEFIKAHKGQSDELNMTGTDATCTTGGSYTYTCECETQQTFTTDKLGHFNTRDPLSTDIATKTEAKCEDAGAYKVTCPDCSAELTDAEIQELQTKLDSAVAEDPRFGNGFNKVIPATGHDFDGKSETKEAAKPADGYVVAKEDGTFDDGWTQDSAPSCTVEGSASRTCKNVGCDYGEAGAAYKETAKIAMTPHEAYKFGEEGYAGSFTMVDPTCTKPGHFSLKCKNCNEFVIDQDLDDSPARGHDFDGDGEGDQVVDEDGNYTYPLPTEDPVKGEDGQYPDGWVEGTAATCSTPGTLTRTCKRDGCDEDTEAEEDQPFTQTYTLKTKPDHTAPEFGVAGDNFVITPATCETNATYTSTCTVCGAELEKDADLYQALIDLGRTEEAEQYKATGHDFVYTWKDETQSHVITCKNNCAYNNKPEAERTEECAETLGEAVEVQANCKNPAGTSQTCSKCEHAYVTAGDDPTLNPSNHPEDQIVLVEAYPATCEGNGISRKHCNLCGKDLGYVSTEPTGHEWKTDYSSTDYNGKPALEGEYSDGQHADKTGWIVVTAPTCTTEGTYHRECTKCDVNQTVTNVPKAGHNYDGAEPKVDMKNHETYVICTVCGGQDDSNHTRKHDAWICDSLSAKKWHPTLENVTTVFEALAEEGNTNYDVDDYSVYVMVETVPADEELTDCTKGQYDEGVRCTACGEWISGHEEIEAPKLRHENTEVVDAKAPTLTEAGNTAGYKCSDCGLVLEGVKELPAHGELVLVEEVEATCTIPGVARHYECTTCQEVEPELVHYYEDAQGETPMTEVQVFLGLDSSNHKNIVDVDAVPPTCTEPGKSAGKKCDDCGVFTQPQTEVAATGHPEDQRTLVVDPVSDELTKGGHHYICGVCEETIEDTVVDHAELMTDRNFLEYFEFVEEEAPGLGTPGHESGLRCKTCKMFVDGGEEIAAHDAVLTKVEGTPANCVDTGTKDYWHCTEHEGCEVKFKNAEGTEVFASDAELNIAVDNTKHKTVVEHPAVKATCTTNGYDAWSECTACETTIVKKVEHEATGHTYAEGVYTPAKTGIEKEEGTFGAHTQVCINEGCNTGPDGGAYVLTTLHSNLLASGQVIEKEEVPPTDSEVGHEKGLYCTLCKGYITGGKEISIHVHAYNDDPDEIQDATCEAPGLKTWHCTVGGKYCHNGDKTEAIPQLKHQFDEENQDHKPYIDFDSNPDEPQYMVWCTSCGKYQPMEDEEVMNIAVYQAALVEFLERRVFVR